MAQRRLITLLTTALLTAAALLLLQSAAWATTPPADPSPNTGSNSADPNADGTDPQPAPDTTFLPNGTTPRASTPDRVSPSAVSPDRPASGAILPDRPPSGAALPDTRARGIAPALLPAQPAAPDGTTPSDLGRTNPATTPSPQGRRVTGTPSNPGHAGSLSTPGRTGAPRAATPGTYPAPNGSADAPAPAATSTQLTIVIAKSTIAGHNGTFTLTCAPTGGSHPDPVNACAKLDQFAAAGQDPFTPTPANQMCSMLYSGPATAHISGTWRGRRISTTFARANSCQTARWNNLLPLLSPESAT